MKRKVEILGNKIDSFADYKDLYNYILLDKEADGLHGYITVNNVHTVMEGYWNYDFQKIINEGYLAIPDGKPLQIVGRLKGDSNISRLFGPTVMEKFIDWGRADGVKHFFLGSSEETLLKLKNAISEKYPGTHVVGMISPPFVPIENWDNNDILTQINSSKADFIWVGLGAPKQEKWMYNQYNYLQKGIMFGIGAGFDYLAGNTKHAPSWMKEYSLEWAYRLTQEPKRLWKRYFTTIPPFILLATLELAGIKINRKDKGKH